MLNINGYSVEELAVLKVKLLSNFTFFIRFFFKERKNTKFIFNWHHVDIIENLIDLTKNNGVECLIFNIPPRYSKTEIAVVNYIPFILANNPRANFVYITASNDLRSQVSSDIKDIIESPIYQKMFPEVKLRADMSSRNLWRTTAGGGLKTATIFGQITGFGAGALVDVEIKPNADLTEYLQNFYGTIILDDINKTDDAEVMNAYSDKVSRVLFNTVFSRKNSKGTQIINIQQRSGMEDATASLEKHYKNNPEKIKVVKYPVIYKGKPLWEFKHNAEDIELLKTSPKTGHMFASQYMQNPKPASGLLFPESELNYFTLPELLHWDSKQSYTDWGDGVSAFCTIFCALYQQKIYVIDVIYNTQTLNKNKPLLNEKIIFNKSVKNYIESNGAGHYFGTTVKEVISDIHKIILYPTSPNSSKIAKINAYSGTSVSRFVFRSDVSPQSEYAMFMEALCSYVHMGSNKRVDAPDAVASYCKILVDTGHLK